MANKSAPPIVSSTMEHLHRIRNYHRKLGCYDWINMPLVYTQVVTIATYGFFGFCLIGRQFLDPHKKYPHNEVDLIVPFFTVLQFLFYIGWIKVAEDLIRPFGTDDDDIELNYILDRNLRVAFTIADKVYDQVNVFVFKRITFSRNR